MNDTKPSRGLLYVVATPIGNLDDTSARMRHTLAQVDQIAAEDTRRTQQLLSHLGLNKPCFSFHEHNEKGKIKQIIGMLDQGLSVALVSDAGTPLISDPGYPLIAKLRQLGYTLVPIPGPCALITALSVSGLPSDRFVFEGFLPAKSVARLNVLEKYQDETATLIFYESCHRIKACIKDLQTVLGKGRRVVIARELTKKFETILDDSLENLILLLEQDNNQSKGEFVVLVSGATKQPGLSDQSKKLALQLAEHLPIKLAAKITADACTQKKNQIYQFLLERADNH